jgi:hypothetical protein
VKGHEDSIFSIQWKAANRYTSLWAIAR